MKSSESLVLHTHIKPTAQNLYLPLWNMLMKPMLPQLLLESIVMSNSMLKKKKNS